MDLETEGGKIIKSETLAGNKIEAILSSSSVLSSSSSSSSSTSTRYDRLVLNRQKRFWFRLCQIIN